MMGQQLTKDVEQGDEVKRGHQRIEEARDVQRTDVGCLQQWAAQQKNVLSG
jgi:hypothetical protein